MLTSLILMLAMLLSVNSGTNPAGSASVTTTTTYNDYGGNPVWGQLQVP